MASESFTMIWSGGIWRLLQKLKLPITRRGSEMSLDRLDLHLHNDHHSDNEFQMGVHRKLDNIITRLANIKTQEISIMSTVDDTLAFVSELNDETNTLAVKVDGQSSLINDLKAQIAAGTPVSQEQLDAINAGLGPISARLRALGADATAPIPPAEPPPAA